MQFLLFNGNSNNDETIKTLEQDFENAEKVYQELHKLNPCDYAYIYLRLKHDIEDRDIIKSVVNLMEKAVYRE